MGNLLFISFLLERQIHFELDEKTAREVRINSIFVDSLPSNNMPLLRDYSEEEIIKLESSV